MVQVSASWGPTKATNIKSLSSFRPSLSRRHLKWPVITVIALSAYTVYIYRLNDYLSESKGGPRHDSMVGIGGGLITSPLSYIIRSELSEHDPLSIWNSTLEAAATDAAKADATGQPFVAVEVGVHSPDACLHAAQQGFLTHCFEPSPKSYARIADSKKLKNVAEKVKARIMLHQEAVGSLSGGMVSFHSTGGIGDHVGEYDMWAMEKRRMDAPPSRKRGEIIEVPTMRLDDFIGNSVRGGKVYLLKVDTQGYEPSIFTGLRDSIQSRAVKFIIFEFWPRGMDLLADTPGECSGRKVLDMLLEAGYELYALNLEAHPKSPLSKTRDGRRNMQREAMTRPMTKGTEAYCRWFFELEERHPSREGEEAYKFGYWADFLAVAPGVKLPLEKIIQDREEKMVARRVQLQQKSKL